MNLSAGPTSGRPCPNATPRRPHRLARHRAHCRVQ
jgi:hypothetical protein